MLLRIWEFLSVHCIVKLRNTILFKKMRKLIIIFSLLVSALGFNSCITYSFTGASIPVSAKTISIGYIENNADFVNPTLSETLTQALRDRFSSQSSLTLIPRGGALQLKEKLLTIKLVRKLFKVTILPP